MLDCIPFQNFSGAASAALSFLQSRLGFDLWMITRIEGDAWVVLQAADRGYRVRPGQVIHWPHTLCYRMVSRNGPRVAPDVRDVSAYRDAPITAEIPIGSYIGVPLNRPDGTLFGTLCAVDPRPKPAEIKDELPLIELLARLLGNLLDAELCEAEGARRSDRVQADGLRDPMTGLYDRMGWEMLLAHEEERCQRFGHPACVITIDLDGIHRLNRTQGYNAGDDLLRRTGQALRTVTLTTHIAARLTNDDFCVLGVECGRNAADALYHRVEEAFKEWRISATMAMAQRDPARGLMAAWREADNQVHLRKRVEEERGLLVG